MIIPSTVGLISHYRLGNVATRALAPIFVGGFAGCAAGSAMAMRLPEKELQILFGVFIGVMVQRLHPFFQKTNHFWTIY